MRINYYQPPENAAELAGCPQDTEGGYKVSSVKALIKKYGGSGYSLHCDRDGGVQDTSEITVKGSNAVKMSHCNAANYGT